MAIFKIKDKQAKKLETKKFSGEKELQNLFERNLDEIFGVRFLATEFSTTHGGRMDTIGLDDNNAPVIIEYKEDEKDNVINQGLFYLDWLLDHKGDFQEIVRKKLGSIEINWDDPRLIIVARSYNEYDKYAVNRISDNIELWRYVLYGGETLLVERVVLPKGENRLVKNTEKKKLMAKEYNLNHHLDGKPEEIKQLVNILREDILKIDDQITEKFNKMYISYSLEKNFAEIVVQTNGLWVQLDADKNKILDSQKKLIDISNKGHWATGNLKIRIDKPEDLPYVIELIEQSYEANK